MSKMFMSLDCFKLHWMIQIKVAKTTHGHNAPIFIEYKYQIIGK